VRIEEPVAGGEIGGEPFLGSQRRHQGEDRADARPLVAFRVDRFSPIERGQEGRRIGVFGSQHDGITRRQVEELQGGQGERGIVQRIVGRRFLHQPARGWILEDLEGLGPLPPLLLAGPEPSQGVEDAGHVGDAIELRRLLAGLARIVARAARQPDRGLELLSDPADEFPEIEDRRRPGRRRGGLGAQARGER
jgi:hypothetical protein